MRIFDFVACGRRGISLEAAAEQLEPVPEQPATPPSPTRRTDEAPVSTATENYQRPRSLMSKSASGNWRPTLYSISEDSAPAMVIKSRSCRVGRGAEAGKGNGRAKIKAAGKMKKISPRSDREDYCRHMAVPPMIPAFAPTAFMF